MQKKSKLALSFDLGFQDLYTPEGLSKIDDIFIQYVQKANAELCDKIVSFRKQTVEDEEVDLLGSMFQGEESELLLKIAILEKFICQLFGVEEDIRSRKDADDIYNTLYKCNKLFIQKQVAHIPLEADTNPARSEEIAQILGGFGLECGWFQNNNATTIDCKKILEFELKFAKAVELSEKYQAGSKIRYALIAYAHWALYHDDGIAIHSSGLLFKIPEKIDYNNLLPRLINDDADQSSILHYREQEWTNRYNFKLNDNTRNLPKSLKEIHYCLYCHNRSKDSCSKGMKVATGEYSANPIGVELHGCPLREKISEMHLLRRDGYLIGAVAMAVLDNPMLVATGHRICNDCMKACIYQKQEPVNIPMIETQNIDDLLDLPWGFEVYSLLTRWNPLSFTNFLPFASNMLSTHKLQDELGKVLVVGMGPAGFTLSHYLLNQGMTVVGIDGLKIEPLPAHISGVRSDGSRCDFEPIYSIKSLFQDLDERPAYGFGGVMEYGITARWNKNYLTVVRLLLERRANFKMYGGVRFGSQITHVNVFDLGFDHVALATGAGRPKLPNIRNVLARGAQTASDFLMSLQLSGVTNHDSIANMQIRLPIVVIGAGLTAFDAATESLTYYCAQVERFLQRHETLLQSGYDSIADLSPEDRIIAQEFIDHATKLRYAPEKQRQLLWQWGGVKIMYRGQFDKSPAYKINHEEVDHALHEGIAILENAAPNGVESDEFGACKGIYYEASMPLINQELAQTIDDRKLEKELRVEVGHQGVYKGIHDCSTNLEIRRLTEYIPARTIIYAIGTEPNTTIARENQGIWDVDNTKYFKLIKGRNFQIETKYSPIISNTLEKHNQQCSYSIFGDNHPKYFGSVVKAMASAKDGYMEIVDLAQNKRSNIICNQEFFALLNELLLAKVVAIHRLNPTVVELIIHAPASAQNFQPGQFFRLQNYFLNHDDNHQSPKKLLEPIALTGASVDKPSGTISLIVLEVGGSTNLCTSLQPGENVALMGPTGTPTELPHHETVMLVGGGLGNAVLFSIAHGLKQNGCRVIYFAGYRMLHDRYKKEMIEANADIVVWACDEGVLAKSREQDISIYGNMVAAIQLYANQQNTIQLQDIDRVIVIGSDSMMAAVTTFIFEGISRVFQKDIKVIASINSPMQCMMKEICAQCLQRHVDPQTGEETFVYSCFKPGPGCQNHRF